jgi:hypothetical protein
MSEHGRRPGRRRPLTRLFLHPGVVLNVALDGDVHVVVHAPLPPEKLGPLCTARDRASGLDNRRARPSVPRTAAPRTSADERGDGHGPTPSIRTSCAMCRHSSARRTHTHARGACTRRQRRAQAHLLNALRDSSGGHRRHCGSHAVSKENERIPVQRIGDIEHLMAAHERVQAIRHGSVTLSAHAVRGAPPGREPRASTRHPLHGGC